MAVKKKTKKITTTEEVRIEFDELVAALRNAGLVPAQGNVSLKAAGSDEDVYGLDVTSVIEEVRDAVR